LIRNDSFHAVNVGDDDDDYDAVIVAQPLEEFSWGSIVLVFILR